MGAKPPPLPPRRRPLEPPAPRKPSPSVDAIPNGNAGHFPDTESTTAKRSIHTELALLAFYYRQMGRVERERLMKAAEFWARTAPPKEELPSGPPAPSNPRTPRSRK